MWIKTIPRPKKGLIMSWDYTFIIIPKNNKKEKIKKYLYLHKYLMTKKQTKRKIDIIYRGFASEKDRDREYCIVEMKEKDSCQDYKSG